jgi:hypothetical protein
VTPAASLFYTLHRSLQHIPSCLKIPHSGPILNTSHSALISFRITVTVILPLAVYRKSVRLGNRSLGTQTWDSSQLDPCGRSPCATSSLTRGCICVIYVHLSNVHIALIAYNWKCFLLLSTQVFIYSRPCKVDRAYLTYLRLQRQLSHLNAGKLDLRQVQASYILCVCLHFVLCCELAYSHDFLWLLFVALIILLYNRMNRKGWKPSDLPIYISVLWKVNLMLALERLLWIVGSY